MARRRDGGEVIKYTMDFETQSAADLKKIGAWEYSVHPTTRCMCLAVRSNNNTQFWFFDFYEIQNHWDDLTSTIFKSRWKAWIKAPDVAFSAHNAFFEQCIYENVLVKRLGWPPIPVHKWRCTAAKAAAVAIPRNLADAGAVMRLTTQKDYDGYRVMMKLCKPTKGWRDGLRGERPPMFYTPETAPDDFQKLYRYCQTDVVTEEKLDESLPDLSSFEQRLWELDQKINLRGVRVDMPLVEKIYSLMVSEKKILGKELDTLTMGLVASGNARNQIIEFLSVEGLEVPDLKAKTVQDFLEKGKATGDAKKLLEIRKALAKSSTTKYEKFLKVAASDGRVRDLFLYHGASTGRWGGKNIQPQNFPRGVLKDIYDAIEYIKKADVETLKLLYGENLMPLFSSVLRGMFIASEGQELYVMDYNAIEARVLFWLAGHTKGLEMFRKGEDPYVQMAAYIYKKAAEEVTEAERQVGKAAVLGCGYQMGGKKFVTSAWDVYRARVDLDMAKVAVTAFRELHYPVTELWANYESAAMSAIESPGTTWGVNRVSFSVENNFLWVTLPSGRKLAYKDPSVAIEDVVLTDDAGNETNRFKAKKIRYWAVNHKAKLVDTTIPKWSREATYGGKLTENITQAVARDILAEAMVRADACGYNVLMHSHDELVSERADGDLDRYKKIVEHLPVWARGLPLKAGGWHGPRYKKG